MNTEAKITVFGIVAVVVTVLSVVTYNNEDSKRREAVARECIAANERIASLPTQQGRVFSQTMSCPWR